jgi:hypothetical protein
MRVLGCVALVFLPPNWGLSPHTIGVGMIVSLLACGITDGRAAAVLDQAGGVSATQAPASEGWAPFESQRGHFQVDRPTTWTVEERVDPQSGLVTTFTGPSGAGISVVVQSGTQVRPDNSDLMNTRCRAVTVSGHAARTCLDTISSALVTTVVGDARTYRITGSRRRGDQRIYDRVLSSFRMLP